MKKRTPLTDHEKGFAHLGLILVVLVIGVVGFIGWRLYDTQIEQKDAKVKNGQPSALAKSREETLKENEEKALAPPEVQTPINTTDGVAATTPQTTQKAPVATTPSPAPPTTPTPTPAPPKSTQTSWITNPTAADCPNFASIPAVWMAKNDAIILYDPEGNPYYYQGTAGYRANLTDIGITIGYKLSWGNNPQWGNKIECYQTGWLKIQNVSAPFYVKWSDVSITAPPVSNNSCTGTLAC